MSAIGGLFLQENTSALPGLLETMSGALAMHGRDGDGIWFQNAVGLVSRRIVFTPQDRLEIQPLLSPDRQIALVFAGRIDNRIELSQDLGISPAHLDNSPDSQFLLLAFLRWGEDCLARIVGDFTFALWEERRQALLLCVSPLSSRPLFYHATPRAFAFATMPKGLFALPFVSRSLDEHYLAAQLARAPREPGTTMFTGIRRVLPGHLLTVRSGDVQLRSFYSPDLSHEASYRRDEDYIDAFLALFERVTRDHLRTESSAGILLSGGLDSTAVAAMAASVGQPGGRTLSAWTSAPHPGFQLPSSARREADETALAEQVARHCGVDHHIIRANGEHLLHEIDAYFEHSETPFRNAVNRSWFEAIFAAASREGIRTLLTGSQGNLTLSWPGRELLPLLVKQGSWRAAARVASHMADEDPSRSAARLMIVEGAVALTPAVWRFAASMRRRVVPDRGERRMSALRLDCARRHGFSLRHQPSAPIVSRQESRRVRWEVMQRTSAAAAGIAAGYQAQFGVELRDPTGDLRLVEFCLSLPIEQFHKDGVTRRLVRRAMAGRLPEEVFANRRRGLQAADWHVSVAGAQHTLLQEIDRIDACPLAHTLIDTERLRDVLIHLCDLHARSERIPLAYRNYLEEGLMLGSFIRWFEAGA